MLVLCGCTSVIETSDIPPIATIETERTVGETVDMTDAEGYESEEIDQLEEDDSDSAT